MRGNQKEESLTKTCIRRLLLTCFLIISLIIICFCLTSHDVSLTWADETAVSLVDDQASLLSTEEMDEIESEVSQLTGQTGWDVMAVTIDDAENQTTQDYADTYFEEHCSQEDGVVLLIDMDNRQYYVSTAGIVIRYVTDDRLEDLLDNAYDEMRSGDYVGAFSSMLNDLTDFYEEGIYDDQANLDTDTGRISVYQHYWLTDAELILALILGLGTAVAIFLVIQARYHMKIGKYHYVWQEHMRKEISRRGDHFVNRVVTRRRIRHDPPPGAGPGGGGGSHMSSMHTSGGGMSHGGGGRGF